MSFEADGTLRYAWHDGSAWQFETVPTTPTHQVGRYSDLALDQVGLPHISFQDDTAGTLSYAWRGVEGWSVETVLTGTVGRIGLYASLALDEMDRPYVSFYDGVAGDLMLARRAGSSGRQTTQTAV